MAIDSNRRSFFFQKSEYHLPFKGKERQQAKRIMKYGIKNNIPPSKVLQSLKNKGLGYRKTNFLSDYAKAHTTESSKTHLKYQRALVFWGGVEKIKKRDNLKNYSIATKKLIEYRTKMNAGIITREQLKELQKLQIDDNEIFGMYPPR